MPRECYCATDGKNDYTAPPAQHYMGHNNYLLPVDMRFGTQDYQLKQPERTLAYAKALQHLADVAKPLQPGEPHQLAECVKELRRCMRLLATFMEEQVLSKDTPSLWVMITTSWDPAMAEEEALESRRERSSKYQRACPWGSFPTPLSWDAVSVSSSLQQLPPLPLPLAGGLACQIFSHECQHLWAALWSQSQCAYPDLWT